MAAVHRERIGLSPFGYQPNARTTVLPVGITKYIGFPRQDLNLQPTDSKSVDLPIDLLGNSACLSRLSQLHASYLLSVFDGARFRKKTT